MIERIPTKPSLRVVKKLSRIVVAIRNEDEAGLSGLLWDQEVTDWLQAMRVNKRWRKCFEPMGEKFLPEEPPVSLLRKFAALVDQARKVEPQGFECLPPIDDEINDWVLRMVAERFV